MKKHHSKDHEEHEMHDKKHHKKEEHSKKAPKKGSMTGLKAKVGKG